MSALPKPSSPRVDEPQTTASPATSPGAAATPAEAGIVDTPAQGATAGSTSQSGAGWIDQGERSNRATLALMRWIATTLGRRLARLVLHPISLYFLLFNRKAAAASTDYLARVFRRAPTRTERYRHIHHFASTILDRVYLLQERFDEFQIEIVNGEALDQVLVQGGGALLVGAHLGSFEVLRALGQSRRDQKVAMVMYEDNARLINNTLRAIAPEHDLHIIALGRLEAMLTLRDWLADGGIAGMLGDRSLPPPRRGDTPGQGAAHQPLHHPLHHPLHQHSVDFLGAPAQFTDGPFRIAALLRQPVVFMAGLYLGGNRYQLRFEQLADFRERAATSAGRDTAVRAALQRYVAMLDELCRAHPYNWFNFFDYWAGGGQTPPGVTRTLPGPTCRSAPAAPPGRSHN
jgi:predicted LPLAT superfamily acyltransferase